MSVKNFFLKKNLIPYVLTLTIIILELVKRNTNFIDHIYSEIFYRLNSNLFIYIFSSIPFSVGDIIYLFVPLIIFSIFNKNNTRRRNLKNLFYFLSIFYVLFQVQWGLNYHRTPLQNKLNFKKKYDKISLIETTKFFIEKTNNVHSEISKNDTLPITFKEDKTEIFRLSVKAGMNISDQKITKIKMKHASVKNSLFSTPLSYMGFGGYINPFTLEVQINKNIPSIQIPTTICHEIAHQKGYSAENEANFIGIISCINSNDNLIKYSGNILALRYLLNELYKVDKKKFDQLYLKINKGIIKNIKQAEKELDKYKNPFEPFLKVIYDKYLKANNQTAGIESYSLVVNLLVNYY